MTLALRMALILALAAPALLAAGEQDPQRTTGFSGKSLYSTYCATCHGPAGKGDGPFAKSLRKPPPDLTQLALANKDVFPAERVTRTIDGRDGGSHGSNDMPVWGDVFARTRENNDPEAVQQRIRALVKFLESIQARAPLE